MPMVMHRPKPAPNPPLTELKSQGVIELEFRCRTTNCGNSAVFSIHAFGENETLGSLRVKAKCSRCGRRKAGISPKFAKKRT